MPVNEADLKIIDIFLLFVIIIYLWRKIGYNYCSLN